MTDDEFTDQLRRQLHARAGQITPAPRLGAILADAQATEDRRSLWIPIAAAVAAAVLGVIVWGATRPTASPTLPGSSGTPVPSVSGSSPSGTSPTASASSSSSAPSSPAPDASSPSAAASTGPTAGTTSGPALPVYVISTEVPWLPDQRWALRRTWAASTVPATDVAGRLRAALTEAMNAEVTLIQGGQPTRPWAGVTLASAAVAKTGITIHLTGGGADLGNLAGFAVQQLTWTAQAVVGKGNVPVTFVRDDGGTFLGNIPSGTVRLRPDQVADDLADVTILRAEPAQPNQPEGVWKVSGEATVFEAALQWEVLDEDSGKVLQSGYTTASAGGPARGTYEISIPARPAGPGIIAVRVFATSPKDGSVYAGDWQVLYGGG